MKSIEEFLLGNCADSYHYFGAHSNGNGIIFRVYAPHAKRVEVIGDFNAWDGSRHVMKKVEWQGVFELYVPNLKEYEMYKYRITGYGNKVIDKTDPYGFFSEDKAGGASKVFTLDGYCWHDLEYMANKKSDYNKPINIYEMHIAGWQHKSDGSVFSYAELAPILTKYLKDHNFTHVEFLPLMEHPLDKSWGYQVTGYYSITSRYGNPHQLMYLIDYLHQNNIGVIFDFVGVHFVTDEHGLAKFDGTYLYEYSDARRRNNAWGTYNFDYGKGQTSSFLLSCVNFYFDYYHIDGIRFDAVSNIIYYNGDSHKGENSEGIKFLKRLNTTIHKLHPSALTIAEDSSAYQGVTTSVKNNGLGFDYKWDLGWMHDTLEYYEMDPIYRKYHHNLITFSMAYFYSEKFILELSHDEVVHGKKNIVDKMWGDYEQKFQQLRNLYTYMYMHPGKKLNFMGNELAHFREFDEAKQLDWFLLDYPMHQQFAKFYTDLAHLYISSPTLYEGEYDYRRFKYLMGDNANQSIIYFIRYHQDSIYCIVVNLTGNSYSDYLIGVTRSGKYQEVFNSDNKAYGGAGDINGAAFIFSFKEGNHGCSQSIKIKIASFAAIVLEYKGK